MAPNVGGPSRATDYDDRGVRAMHAVLIELGQILGSYRDSIVIVGGVAPYLMLRDADPAHIGTLDIDLDLNPERLSKGVYAELVETLERAGYEGDTDELKPFQLRRTVDPRDGGDSISVLVDLLMPRNAGLRIQGADGEEISQLSRRAERISHRRSAVAPKSHRPRGIHENRRKVSIR